MGVRGSSLLAIPIPNNPIDIDLTQIPILTFAGKKTLYELFVLNGLDPNNPEHLSHATISNIRDRYEQGRSPISTGI